MAEEKLALAVAQTATPNTRRRKKTEEQYFLEKYPALFDVDAPGILYLGKLTISRYDGSEDFSAEIPARRISASSGGETMFNYLQTGKYIADNRAHFFQYVRERMERDGRKNMRDFRVAECIVTKDGLIRVSFTPKREKVSSVCRSI